MNKINIPDSVTFHTFVDELPLENPKMLESQTYMQYLKNAFSFFNTEEPTEEEQKNYLGDTKFKLRSIKSVIEDPQIANALYYETLMDYANYQGFDGLETEYKYLKENLEDSSKLAEIKKLHAVWEKISPGKKAPGFTYPTNTGDSISLSDYRGKLVYIDVWATWCAPCRQELPYLDTLYQEYKGSELVILSVSVDERRQQWIDFLEQDKPGWKQLHTGGWDCSICDDYHIQGIPRFILIDRDGTIITTSAPRPSSDDIRPLIDKHLKMEV
jgi:thiol-disulfide isomerase/thioredoxin